jgi:hypothetical protein
MVLKPIASVVRSIELKKRKGHQESKVDESTPIDTSRRHPTPIDFLTDIDWYRLASGGVG